MALIADWKNDSFLKSRDTKGFSYDMMVYGIGLMNDEIADLTQSMLEYYGLKISEGKYDDKEAKTLRTVSGEQFLSYTFGKQKNLIDYVGTRFDKDSKALGKILEGRNYFIHSFRMKYLANKSILSDEANRLKDLILSIRKQNGRFNTAIQQMKSVQKKKQNVKQNNVSKRTLVVDRDELCDFINYCIKQHGTFNGVYNTLELVELGNLVNDRYPNLKYSEYGGKNKFSSMLVYLGFLKKEE